MGQLTINDIKAFDDEFFVDVLHSDLKAALAYDEGIIHEARQWGWDDTEVRDRTTTAIEKATGKVYE